MKWNKRINPEIGDVRIIRKFAWLPVLIDGQYIWLEKYYVRQEYKRCTVPGLGFSPGWNWIYIYQHITE